MTEVWVVGGYGNFGKRLVAGLASAADLDPIAFVIIGRRLVRAQAACAAWSGLHPRHRFTAGDGATLLARAAQEPMGNRPRIVVNAAGPFQGGHPDWAGLCAERGWRYVDLADDAGFVAQVQALDAQAQSTGAEMVTGASSVPGLSSAVVEHFLPRFAALDSIDVAIAPGNRAERGLATVAGVLSYLGQPFDTLQDGHWVSVRGWADSRRLDFGTGVGRRWVANVDVPDRVLFPQRYAGVQTVRFQASLELPWLHHTLALGAWLARWTGRGVSRRLAGMAFAMSRWTQGLGTPHGAMRVALSGRTSAGHPLRIDWTLTALDGSGPYLPTLPALALVRHWLSPTSLPQPGARACVGLVHLDTLLALASPLGIHATVETAHG